MDKKLTKEEFLEKLKTDREFNSRYGRKNITEGKMALPPCHWAFELYTEELTIGERISIAKEMVSLLNTFLANNMGEDEWVEQCDLLEVPKRRLSLKWHQRSVDTFLGLPFNIASYGLLLHMFAQQTNMVAGTLIGDLTNVHIYQNHIEQCKEQISRESFTLPKLELVKAKDIFSYSYDDIKIVDYISHGPIKGDISV